jgi:hypothetical protein
MALTRGTQSLFPCPRDLTPRDKLNCIGSEFESRTALKTLEIIDQATRWTKVAGLKTKAEKLLKAHSLRPVPVRLGQLSLTRPLLD